MKQYYKKTAMGFTLIEVMIAIVIVAIITSIALPSYRSYVLKAKRSAAKSTIASIASRQETYRMDNKTYTNDLSNLGYGSADFYINDESGISTSTAGLYLIDVTTADADIVNEFSVTATAKNTQEDDTRCISFTIDHLNNKTATGSDAANCW